MTAASESETIKLITVLVHKEPLTSWTFTSPNALSIVRTMPHMFYIRLLLPPLAYGYNYKASCAGPG